MLNTGSVRFFYLRAIRTRGHNIYVASEEMLSWERRSRTKHASVVGLNRSWLITIGPPGVPPLGDCDRLAVPAVKEDSARSRIALLRSRGGIEYIGPIDSESRTGMFSGEAGGFLAGEESHGFRITHALTAPVLNLKHPYVVHEGGLYRYQRVSWDSYGMVDVLDQTY